MSEELKGAGVSECSKCGKEFESDGRKQCPTCRAYVKQNVDKHREIKKHSAEDGPSIKEKEAVEILRGDRGLRNPHVIEFCVASAQSAARVSGIPDNHHLF